STPNGTIIPGWANVDPRTNDSWNALVAKENMNMTAQPVIATTIRTIPDASGIAPSAFGTPSTPSNSSESPSIVGLIVGGVIGGIALLSLFCIVTVFCLRRRRTEDGRGEKITQKPPAGIDGSSNTRSVGMWTYPLDNGRHKMKPYDVYEDSSTNDRFWQACSPLSAPEELHGVANGKKTINGATLGPHELVKEALELATECEKDSHLSEASRSITKNQWNSMIERLREAGTLENYIAVCDLSGSMGTLSHSEFIQRILPAISLPSPNHHSTTRSSLPMIPKITNISSHTQTDPISTREDMVKRIFVFSDMQFDEARQVPGGRQGNKWDPNHQQIVKMFEDADYDMPEIVHWNLAGTASATGPITKNTPGEIVPLNSDRTKLLMFTACGHLGHRAVVPIR
ncbi:hypothetical protein FRB97_006370, partial [Tulasnella sp. 331]